MFTPRKIEERQLTVKRLLEDTASNMCTSLADESLLEGLTGIEHTLMHILVSAEIKMKIINNKYITLYRNDNEKIHGIKMAYYDPIYKHLSFYVHQGGAIKRKLMKQHGLRKDFFECSDNRMLKEIIEKNLNIEIEFMSL